MTLDLTQSLNVTVKRGVCQVRGDSMLFMENRFSGVAHSLRSKNFLGEADADGENEGALLWERIPAAMIQWTRNQEPCAGSNLGSRPPAMPS
jgi:hypothetical protein